MLKYLRYFATPVLVSISIYFAAMGKEWIWIYLIGFNIFVIFGDSFLGNDRSTPEYKYPIVLRLLLFINLPLIAILVSIAFYMAGHLSYPAFEQVIMFLTGHDISLTRIGTEPWHLAGYIFTVGLMMGPGATIPGHELVHHKKNKLDWIMGNLMLSFSIDNAFAVEHVHGHHKHVGLASDPATAKRGQSLYRFFIESSIKEHRDAWKIELKRLKKRGHYVFSLYNKMIIGYLQSSIIAVVAILLAGWYGVLMFIGIAMFAKFFLESINYVEHYGLVRIKGTPVELHHSWNTNKWISSILLYNVTRHSHHHEQGSLEFWKLRPKDEAPEMPYGYLSTLYLVVFLPWLYRIIMEPKLEYWIENFASKGERELLLQK